MVISIYYSEVFYKEGLSIQDFQYLILINYQTDDEIILFIIAHLFWVDTYLIDPYPSRKSSLVTQMVKHLPTMGRTQVRSLGREDPLEKEMATHSSTLAWKIPWTEERGRLQSMGSQSRT